MGLSSPFSAAASDARLVRRSLAGDSAAAEALVLRYLPRARAVALAAGAPRAEIDDVIQQAFLQALGGLRALRDPERFGPWFLAIARNAARRHARSGKRGVVAASPLLDSLEGRGERPLEVREIDERLWREVAALPENIREAVLLYYHDGESVKAVAAALGISRPAVKMRLQRGRDALRERLWSELEEILRDILPDARESRRLARKISLLVAALPALAGGASRAASTDGPARGGGAAARGAGSWSLAAGVVAMETKVKAVLIASGMLLLGGAGAGTMWYFGAPAPDPVARVGDGSKTEVASPPPAPAVIGLPAPGAGGAELAGAGDPVADRSPLHLRVTGEDGGAVAGARVSVSAAVGAAALFPEPLVLETDANGEAATPDLPPASCFVRVEARGYFNADVEAATPLEAPLDVTLRRATFIAGRAYVRDLSHPLRNATIDFMVNRASGHGGWPIATGGDGAFQSPPLESGAYLVTFLYPDFRPVTLEASLTVENPLEGAEIVFEEGIRAGGEIVRTGGGALPFALHTWRRSGGPPAELIRAHSDAQGRFSVRGLAPGTYRVEVMGYSDPASRTREVIVSDDGPQDLRIEVDFGPVVLVRVEDARGEPMPGARVQCHLEERGGGRQYPLPPADDAGMTGAAGMPPEGKIVLHAGSRDEGEARVSVDLASEPGPLLLRLAPWGRLRGVVVGVDGEPVPRAAIRPQGAAAPPVEAVTGGDGAFEIDLPASEWTLLVRAGELGTAEVEGVLVEPPGDGDAAGAAGEVLRIEVGGAVDRLIRGRVVDADGAPIPGVRIEARADRRHAGRHGHTYSDDDGWFSLDLPADGYELTARQDGGKLAPATVEGVRPGDPPIEIVLRAAPERSLAGVVIHGGVPYEGARVTFSRIGERSSLAHHLPDAAPASGDGGAFTLSLGASEAKLESIVVVATSPDFAWARSGVIRLPLEGMLDGIRVDSLPGADLEVRVAGEDGRAASDAQVDLRGDGDAPLRITGRTDAEGTWRLPALPAGKYRVQAYLQPPGGYGSASFEWDAGAPGRQTVVVRARGGERKE